MKPIADAMLATAKVSHFYEEQIERITRRKLGRELGKEFFEGWHRSATDYEFGLRFLWGVKLLPWQRDELFKPFFQDDPVAITVGRMGNSGGKTTSFTQLYLGGCSARWWADPSWGLYRAIHFGPKESHALETKVKIDEFIRGRAREQWDDERGEFRPAPMRYFVQATKFGPHHGYEFFPVHIKGKPDQDFVSATLSFMPTAGKGESGDGTDPMIMGLDEGRHERNLMHIFYRIWVIRTLRTPGAKIYIPYTSLEASPDLEAIKAQAEADTSGDFHEFDVELSRRTNPTIRKVDLERVMRILPKHIREQVRTGKASQPMGARFSAHAVAAAFDPPPEPAIHSKLEGLRDRVIKRCPKCAIGIAKPGAAESEGHPRTHLMVGALDPASSAPGADDTVFKVWDVDAPGTTLRPRRIVETVLTITCEPGTKIQEVARIMASISREVKGPVGYDRKSALGHNIEDLVVDLDPDGEYVPVAFNTHDEKLRAVDFFRALVEGELWSSAFHHSTRLQMLNYVINDRHLMTDHLMCEVIAAQVSMPYLPIFQMPDGSLEKNDAPGTVEDQGYAAMTGQDWYGAMSGADVYAGATGRRDG
jgi:hypothetical protein